ncbi:MAG: hypothetical protein ACOX0C_03105 [Patescibacteria group bacterium]|jgi:hypothetical protein
MEYILKSGKHAGKSLSWMLKYQINDFLALKYNLETKGANPKSPNQLHRSLISLVARVDQAVADTKCQCCLGPAEVTPVRFFGGSCHLEEIALCRDCFFKRLGGQGLSAISLSPWRMPGQVGDKKVIRAIWKVTRKTINFK